jgi:uncharacterized protein
MSDPFSRRDFLKHAAAVGAAVAVSGGVLDTVNADAPPPLPPVDIIDKGRGAIPHKKLGDTGVTVSIIGVGGSSLGDAPSYDEAEKIVHQAVDAGVTFFDNAWEYHGGRSEEWMGKALAGRRDKVFLMTKACTHGRDGKVAMQQLADSLRRFKTDHLDLWQVHECIYWNDPELHFRQGGVVEAMVQAKKQGKVRFIGFTGHKHPDIHLKMLALADRHGVKFDTAQMPLNAFDASFRSFEKNVVPECRKRGMGVLGMKSLGGGGQPLQLGAITVTEALRYAMSLPVATTVSGIDSLGVLTQNLGIARDFVPMTAAEMESLRNRCFVAAGDGHLELYKTTKKFDAALGRHEHGYPSPEDLPL